MSEPIKITVDDVEQITAAIERRQELFDGESLTMSVGVVLLNYGDRFTEISCVGGEWSGTKRDLPSGRGGIPRCPAGHPLMQGAGRRVLALIDDTEMADLVAAMAAQADDPGVTG